MIPYNNIISHTVPSAAPLSLSVISGSPDSLNLQWLPPPEDGQNGIIISYSVNVTHNSTGDVQHFSGIKEQYFTVEFLSPYTAYLCSVAAHTTIGMGPYAVPELAITDEDGMIVVYIIYTIVDSFSIIILYTNTSCH